MFRFSLSSLLKYRRQVEKIRQQELANSIHTWEQERAKLEHYHRLWRTCLEEWKAAQTESVAIHEVELYQRYMIRLREEIRYQVDKVKHCLSIIDEKRTQVLKAQKELKIIEKLYSYEYDRYCAEQRYREARFNDEIATQRHIKKSQIT